MSNLSPTGSGAPEWLNVNGGSFALDGHFGTNNDYMLNTFINCMQSAADGPTRIEMGCAVYTYWLMACDRQTALLSLSLKKALASPLRRFSLVLELDALKDLLAKMTDVLSALQSKSRTYHGADVRLSHALPDDVMQYFIGDELVGEIYGWTA
jgi:hypothetical protein